MNFTEIPFGGEIELGLLFIRGVDIFDTGKELEVLIDPAPVDLAIFLLSTLRVDGPRLCARIAIAVVDMDSNPNLPVRSRWSSCHGILLFRVYNIL
jgi:hypothetical protein